MTRFRPCIDLHNGRVKQIVGGTLRDDDAGPQTNFESDQPPSHYAEMYRDDALTGGHVIKLGPGNDDAARVTRAFESLSPAHRRVLGLRQFEGLSAREAAARTGSTEKAVHSLYRRALEAWERALEATS